MIVGGTGWIFGFCLGMSLRLMKCYRFGFGDFVPSGWPKCLSIPGGTEDLCHFGSQKFNGFCQSDPKMVSPTSENDWFWRLTHASDGFCTQNCHSGSLWASKTNLGKNVGPFTVTVREKKLQKVKYIIFIPSPHSNRQLEKKFQLATKCDS